MTARKLQISVDNLKLEASFEKGSLKSEMALSAQGLFLQGSGFKHGQICEPEEGQSEYIKVPALSLAWTPVSMLALSTGTDQASFPIFLTGSRENSLCKVELPV